MYDWMKEINELIQDTKFEKNDIKTRENVTQKTINILKNHNVVAIVDCSSKINTPEVINHGDFHMLIETEQVSYLIRYQAKN